jgi:hypothetical protein
MQYRTVNYALGYDSQQFVMGNAVKASINTLPILMTYRRTPLSRVHITLSWDAHYQ